jgi:hypothetical protein
VFTDQPFREGLNGGTQVEPEDIRQKVQQEGKRDGWQCDATTQARYAENAWRPQGH